jgi:hypothetical protein
MKKDAILNICAKVATRYFLLNSFSMHRGRFKTGVVIPASGIYSVRHAAHRLPHEVTLLKGETFPKCQKCADAVTFKLVRMLTYQTAAKDSSWRVTLYELPIVDGDNDAAKVG